MNRELILISTLMSVPTLTTAAGWGGFQEIIKFNLDFDAGLYIKQTSMINPDNCTYNDYYLVNKDTNPMFKEYFSMLLAAKKATTPISIYVSGCDSVTARPLVRHLNEG